MSEFSDTDVQAAEHWRRGGQPALAYGIVRDGKLVHAGGFGERYLGGPPPDADTVFRIASMTKSFTASAVLMLRDEGLLDLDDPAETYVRELRGWQPVTPDSARVTVRHLLTMTAGLATDDPWGDRQQGLPLDEFDEFLSRGVTSVWAPGTRFEYSNLGFAIVGRLITSVSGMAYPEFVAERLLRPLGMSRTGYEAGEFLTADFEAANLAHGYRRAPSGWSEQELDPCGAFAPMGGVFSTVRDLAVWVAGFAAAFPPGDGKDPHPLRAASRREMQLPQVQSTWNRPATFPVAAPQQCYAFGLVVEDHPELGRVVHHAGGYPGFGSHMRWHPATGIGVIGLANGTYAAPVALTDTILASVVRAHLASGNGTAGNGTAGNGTGGNGTGGTGAGIVRTGAAGTGTGGAGSIPLAPHGGAPWPATLAAKDEVNRLLQSWDDDVAARLFSPNVAQDAPYTERRHTIDLVRERIGAFREDDTRPPQFGSPAQCRWWLMGEHGTAEVGIMLTPELSPRVQSMSVAVPPAPGSGLHDVLDRMIGWLNGGAPVPSGEGIDTDVLDRRIRSASAWAGHCVAGAYRAGDGIASVTVEVEGEHATLTLGISIDPATRHLHRAEISA